jgi:hypothetical protein
MEGRVTAGLQQGMVRASSAGRMSGVSDPYQETGWMSIAGTFNGGDPLVDSLQNGLPQEPAEPRP